MIKAVIFDIDGTLTISKSVLEPKTGILLAELMTHIPIAIMSGGSYAQFQKQLLSGIPENAHFENLYLFPTSAAQCYKWENGTWQFLYNNPFTEEEREHILIALHEALRETGLDQPPPRLWGEQIEDRGAQITWSALGQQAPIEMKEIWDPDREKRKRLQTALMARIDGFSIRINATSSVDITRQGMTKAYGIRQFSHITTIPITDMLYVGDALFPGGNDEIVKETGIATQQVDNPTETIAIIENIIRSFNSPA